MARRKTTKAAKTSSTVTVENDVVTIEIRPYEKDNLLGFATLILYDEVYIYNCRIVDGKKGAFLAYPSYEGSDGKYYNYAYLDKDSNTAKLIQELVDQYVEGLE